MCTNLYSMNFFKSRGGYKAGFVFPQRVLGTPLQRVQAARFATWAIELSQSFSPARSSQVL